MYRILWVLTGLLLIAGMLPGTATQAQLSVEGMRVPHVIEAVELLPPLHPDTPVLMRVSGYQPDGCELPVNIEQTVSEDHLRVEIYRLLPPDMMCSQQIVLFDEVIELSDEAVHMLLDPIMALNDDDPAVVLRSLQEWHAVIEVNDFTGVLLGEEIIPAERVPLNVDSVELYLHEDDTDHDDDPDAAVSSDDPNDIRVGLQVEGTHPDGCREPYYSYLTVSGDTLNVQIYRVQLPDTERVCPAVIRSFSTLIDLASVPPGDYTYDVNDVTGEITVPGARNQQADGTRVPHVIDSVDVQLLESYPVQVQLEVSGYQSDGCETEVFVDVERRDDTIQVEIYRVLPPFVACPMMIVDYAETISLGTFEPGDYRVTVNGVSVEFTVD